MLADCFVHFQSTFSDGFIDPLPSHSRCFRELCNGKQVFCINLNHRRLSHVVSLTSTYVSSFFARILTGFQVIFNVRYAKLPEIEGYIGLLIHCRSRAGKGPGAYRHLLTVTPGIILILIIVAGEIE